MVSVLCTPSSLLLSAMRMPAMSSATYAGNTDTGAVPLRVATWTKTTGWA